MNDIFLLDPEEAFHVQVQTQCAEHALEIRWFRGSGPFFRALETCPPRCIIMEMELEDASGLEIQARLADAGFRIPLIFAARLAEPPLVVQAIKSGAHDFLVKPVATETLCDMVRDVLEIARSVDDCEQRKLRVRQRMLTLTGRENEVLALALTGKANKEISRLLDISPRTVEAHRARVLDKIGLNNLLELAHVFADAADWSPSTMTEKPDDDGAGEDRRQL